MSTSIAHAAFAIAAVLFDSLWEGALIVGAVWLGLRCVPAVGAATRYAIWLCALAALVLTPILTVSLAEQRSDPTVDTVVTAQQSSVYTAPAPQPQLQSQPRIGTPRTVPEPVSVVSEPAPAAAHKPQITIPQRLAVAAALVWILVACARGLLLLLNVRALAAIRRDASLSAADDYPIFLSDRVQAPFATGFLRAVPNRGIRTASFFGMKMRPGSPLYGVELPDPDKVAAKFGAAHVATFDLTVDAAGRPRKVVVVTAPRYPGMVEHVRNTVMGDTYLPALHDCVPVAVTTRRAYYFGTPIPNASSIVVPAYPTGWSAQHASACKVPTLQHTGVPAYPDALKNLSVDTTYSVSVRVHLNAAGAVTSATIVTPSGQPAFDHALLAAARQATYPLADSTGFRQARPSGAPLSWNAAHGSDTFVNCKPLPTDYVWNTTFSRAVPTGVLGATTIVLHR